MKKILSVSILLVVTLLAAKPAAAQSSNAQATTWFKIGINEKEPAKKIVAYLKALEFDPLFVEALYNLGVTFKKQQDYQRAEQYLLQAYNARPDKIQNDFKLKILYELATTYKRLGKTRETEEALRQAKSLAAEPSMRATLALELGRFYYEQDRYQAALAELREGQQQSPAKSGEFTVLIQSTESAIELQRLYDAAQKAVAGGNLRQAKAQLEQIRAKKPGYKNVEAKLAELDSQLNAETQKTTLTSMYEQAQKHAANGNFELAITAYESITQQDGNYKDVRARLEAARQQLAQKQLDEKVEAQYAAGLAALRVRNWTRAILSFEQVLEADRNFRDARRRLTEAQNGLDRESTETVVARYYAEGVSDMNKNDLGGALAAFEKVRRINPNYRDVANLYAEVDAALSKKVEVIAGTKPSPAAPAKVDSIYQAGLTAFERKDWMPALVAFEKVQLLQPNYRDIVDRLAEARARLETAKRSDVVAEAGESGGKALYIGGALAALVLLPLIGAVVFSPAARARLHLMRGDYVAATQIYEHLLVRHPDKVKLYLALAKLYLLMGRKDESAVKVYKMVLQLNLATSNRDEMSTIVAQSFLTEGRTDTDAIEVMESALKAEQRRQSQ